MAALQADKVPITYAHSQEYLEYVAHCLELAASTYRHAKIRLFADVAAGAARDSTSDVWRDKFVAATDALTVAHVEVLNAMGESAFWIRPTAGELRRLDLELPQFDAAELEVFVRDLVAVGFVEDHTGTRYGGFSGAVWIRTSVGERFLTFLPIRAPTV